MFSIWSNVPTIVIDWSVCHFHADIILNGINGIWTGPVSSLSADLLFYYTHHTTPAALTKMVRWPMVYPVVCDILLYHMFPHKKVV